MPERKETKKYTFTVEGETEKWYLDWLAEQINSCEEAKYKVSIVAKVQQSPSKFAKSQTTFCVTINWIGYFSVCRLFFSSC